jgi:hypothetical protein
MWIRGCPPYELNCSVAKRVEVHVLQPEDSYEFHIHPGPPEWGGGWQLFLYKNGVEVGRGFYPSVQTLVGDAAYTEAYEYGRAWVSSRAPPRNAP